MAESCTVQCAVRCAVPAAKGILKARSSIKIESASRESRRVPPAPLTSFIRSLTKTNTAFELRGHSRLHAPCDSWRAASTWLSRHGKVSNHNTVPSLVLLIGWEFTQGRAIITVFGILYSANLARSLLSFPLFLLHITRRSHRARSSFLHIPLPSLFFYFLNSTRWVFRREFGQL